ncbi:MAG: HAD family hydrolase [archaeon]
MKIKAVLMDLDHTLYDYHACNDAGMDAVFGFIEKEYSKKRDDVEKIFYAARKKVKMDLLGAGASHSRLLYFQKMLEEIEGTTNPKTILEVYNLFWDTYFEKMKVPDGIRKLLEHIKTKKVKIVLVTDLTARVQMQKLEKMDLGNLIDFVVTSEEAGREKPAPYIYYLALEKAKCDIDEAIFIGDDYDKDIAGAENLGIKNFNLSHNSDWKEIWALFE